MEKLIFIVGPGHCNNEYVSWVLNHSPDTGPRQPYSFTHYDSIWGTHYRAQDEWMLEQYDGVEPGRTDFISAYSSSGLRNPSFPHFLKRDLFDEWIPRLIQLHKYPVMCLYLNVVDVGDTIHYIKSQNLGVDVQFVTSFWDFENFKNRHWYIMMEYDPTSTDDTNPPFIDIDFMCQSLVDRHNSQSKIWSQYADQFDLIAFQSHNPEKWFETLELTKPANLDLILENYSDLNATEQDILLELNDLAWSDIKGRCSRKWVEWCQDRDYIPTSAN